LHSDIISPYSVHQIAFCGGHLVTSLTARYTGLHCVVNLRNSWWLNVDSVSFLMPLSRLVTIVSNYQLRGSVANSHGFL